MDSTGHSHIEVYGAREHNLQNVHIKIPRNQLVVLTGISGSGKSSLAFDTIYAEGQRRYLESFSAYARNFIGSAERPDVDKITGLSPVISIEQKSTSRNPRSTVGTVTEIYDFFRLLFARIGEAHSYVSGKKMIKQSEDQIRDAILENFNGKAITFLAPVVKGRKGHYRELFEQIRKKGYVKARVDGVIKEITAKMQVDRFKMHDIEIVINKLAIKQDDIHTISQTIQTTLNESKGIMQVLDDKNQLYFYSKFLVDPESDLSYDEPAPNLFSFNSPYGYCPSCTGLGEVLEIPEAALVKHKTKSILDGGIPSILAHADYFFGEALKRFLASHKLTTKTPIEDFPKETLHKILYGELQENSSSFIGLVPYLKAEAYSHTSVARYLEEISISATCAECRGARINKVAQHYFIDKKNIVALSEMTINTLSDWVENLETRLGKREQLIAQEVLKEIRKRIKFLLDVGLDYLHLNRSIQSLSGGESQRIRLATQIGTQLTGVLYILDEPSIGLHARDNEKLIHALQSLRDLGNSVIVVEHDKEMMLQADYVIDVGPGAGKHGGKIIGEGTPKQFLKNDTTTAQYLSGKKQIPFSTKRRKGNGHHITIHEASGHNLKNVSVSFPLGALVCVTGVSGSGKSSLVNETLLPHVQKHFRLIHQKPLPCKKVEGLDELDKVIEVDQSPIGRTPRSNPATYTQVFTEIRNWYAQLPEAKIRGYKPGRFSFNVPGGRCDTCLGGGIRLIEMDFLPDVYVPCETCMGKRYNRETLDIRYKGKSIADVLDMTIEEAVVFFDSHPRIKNKIQTIADVGLSYISLGQHATTLSGGEAQRIKLATELSKRDTGKTLYIFDEPTTGLHFQDIHHLLLVFHKLVEKGNTVVVIEHNMDIIKAADYIIDMGPDGGERGGTVVAMGTPEQVIKNGKGFTAQFLKMELENEQEVPTRKSSSKK